MTKRRVVIADAYPHVWGGSHSQTLRLLEGLTEVGFEATLLTPGIGVLTSEAAARGVATTVVPAVGALGRYERQAGAAGAFALPAYWARVSRALRRADLVHANDHRGVLMVGPAARAARLPVVWHVHARAAGPVVDRLCARIASALVVPTAASGADLRRFGRPVHVVEGVVRRPTTSWSGGASHGIAAVGRLYPSKGLHHLLEAVAHVRQQLPDVTLDVVGDPPSPGSNVLLDLRARARSLGIQGAVTFHGHLDDPWLVAARAGVFVQASTGEETQGLALREARLAGMPVVATDLPAWRDIPSDAMVRVAPGDTAALANAIVDVLEGRADTLTATPGTDAHSDLDLLRSVADVYRTVLGE